MNNNFTIEDFRAALIEFSHACINMKSNEKAFQAYYAYFMINKINEVNNIKDGYKFVHREGHLDNARLKLLINEPNNCQIANNIKTEYFQNEKPWQLYPDLSISHIQIDNRHSRTREFNIEKLNGLTNNVADWLITQNIISEFKATGSIIDLMNTNQIIRDISKLAVFATAYVTVSEIVQNNFIDLSYSPQMSTCMVILDNYQNEPLFAKERMHNGVLKIKDQWPKNITPPYIFVLLKWEGNAKVDTYEKWELKKYD